MLQKKKKVAINTIKMVREPNTNPPPYEADVNLLEVENYKKGGWSIKDKNK